MTALARHLAGLIAREGPLSLAPFMAAALGHPRWGYYASRDPLGAAGDFVTAPEISQMFGELLGLWVAQAWQARGGPSPALLVELGPGRGTLMADALRALDRAAPASAAALGVHLVETSPVLRAAQEARLGDRARWHAQWGTLPEGPIFIIANEFFDALPVRQFLRLETGWHERLVAVSGSEAEPRFHFVVAPLAIPGESAIPPRLRASPVGTLVTRGAAGEALVGAIAERIAREGGAALIVDYGEALSAPGDSLQAVRAHRHHPVLEAPGSADITAHVDFEMLAAAARAAGASVHGPVAQGTFLRALGIDARAARLAAAAGPEERLGIESALARLTGEAHMGALFKVLALTAPGAPTPAGFEP